MPVFEKGTQDPVQDRRRRPSSYARHYGRDMVIIDTAGRLHIDEALMEELRNIKATVKPQEILLVVDAMTGQDAVNVAKTFNERAGHRRRDPDQAGRRYPRRRGAFRRAPSPASPSSSPASAKSSSDIEPFHPDRMASRILGMGDVLTLIEKAQEAFDEKEAEKLVKVRPAGA